MKPKVVHYTRTVLWPSSRGPLTHILCRLKLTRKPNTVSTTRAMDVTCKACIKKLA